MINLSVYRLQVVKEKGGRYDLEGKKITSPTDALNIINALFNPNLEAEEVLNLLVMNTKNNVIGAFEVSRGSLNASIVHPREVLKRVLMINGASMILTHNHPSGDPAPSKEDINITQRLKEAAAIMGIEFLDHIITGDNRYLSMKDKGLL